MRILTLIMLVTISFCNTTFADMPIPKTTQKDVFFQNVEEIIIVPITSIDDLVSEKKNDIDYQKIISQTNQDLSTGLEGNFLAGKNITITKYPDKPFRKDKHTNTKSVVLKVLISYKAANLDGKQIYLGSIVPILWRSSDFSRKLNYGFNENYTDLAFAETFVADSPENFYIELSKANTALAKKIVKWSSN